MSVKRESFKAWQLSDVRLDTDIITVDRGTDGIWSIKIGLSIRVTLPDGRKLHTVAYRSISMDRQEGRKKRKKGG